MARLRRPRQARRTALVLAGAAAAVLMLARGSSAPPAPLGALAGTGGAGGSSSSSNVHTGIFYKDKVNGSEVLLEVLDEPIPADCYPQEALDLDGQGLTWGLNYKKQSAAQCCQACKELPADKDGRSCSLWVFCPSPTGECWSPDIWNHTTGECWLKYQKDWDGGTDLATSNIKINKQADYPEEFRKIHKTTPQRVQWMSGLNPPKR